MDIIARIKNEPVLVAYGVTIVISAIALFGFEVPAEAVGLIDAGIGLGAAVFARQRVVPVAKLQKLEPEQLIMEFAETITDEVLDDK